MAETSRQSGDETAEYVTVEETSPELSAAARGSFPLRSHVSMDAEYDSGPHSTYPSVTNASAISGPSTIPMTLPSGKPGAAVTRSGLGEEAPAIPKRPTCPKVAPSLANKYELRVVPDEHSIVDDALLKSTPYIINTKYMVLICTDCRYCILPDRALQHLRKDHSHCKVDTAFSEQLNKRFPGLVAEAIHPSKTIEAVFGLAISDEEFTVCSRCRRGYVNVSTWEHHVCRNRDANPAERHPHFRSHVQTFFRGPRICYFPIEVPDLVSDETSGDDFDLFKTDFQELAASDDEIHDSEDYRELNQFLLKEGWIDHVSGFRSSELSLLTCFPTEGEVMKSIGSDVVALMSNTQTAIGNAGYHVRRLLGRRPAYVFLFSMLYYC